MLAQSPDGGFADEGVSLHVNGTDDGHEYLRFDVFDGEPHYHYVSTRAARVATSSTRSVDYDVNAHGDMLTWALDCIRTRLPQMLPHAGGADLVAQIDPTELDVALVEVTELATAAQAAHRERTGA